MNCRTLDTISLRNNHQITSQAVTTILRQCPFLRCLDIANCSQVGGEAFQLEGVKTYKTKLSDGKHEVQYGKPKHLALRSLVLANVTEMGNDGLEALSQIAPALQKLVITGMFRASDSGLCKLFQSCVDLECLHLIPPGDKVSPQGNPRISDKSLLILGRTCRKLRSLALPPSNRITDAGLCGLSKNCSRKFIYDTVNAHHVMDDFTGIEELHIPGARNVTDEGLIQVATNNPGLRELSLTNCEGITSAGVGILAVSCSKLVFLSLAKCNIDDYGLEAIARECTHLQSLNFSWNPVTDVGVGKLLRSCKMLSCVQLSGLEGLCDRSIRKAAAFCPLLHTLILGGNEGVSPLLIESTAGALPLACLSESTFGVVPAFPPSKQSAYANYMAKCWKLIQGVEAIQAKTLQMRDAFSAYSRWLKSQERDRQQREVALQKLQRWYVAKLTRRWYVEQRRRAVSAVNIIQRVYRGWKERSFVERLTRTLLQKLKAVTTLQSHFRGSKAREHFRRLKWAQQKRVGQELFVHWYARHWAAIKIETFCRGVLACNTRRKVFNEKSDATLTVQRLFRGHVQRRQYKQQKEAIEKATRSVQKLYRGRRGRQDAKKKWELFQLETKSALNLQRVFRGSLSRWMLKRQMWENLQRDVDFTVKYVVQQASNAADEIKGSIVIAKTFKGFMARRQAGIYRKLRHFEFIQLDAAKIIQRNFRAFARRNRLRQRQRVVISLMQKGHRIEDRLRRREAYVMHGACVCIQQWWKHALLRNASANVIQKVWRGFVERSAVAIWRKIANTAATFIQRKYRRALWLRYWRSVVQVVLEIEADRIFEVETRAARKLQSAWWAYLRRKYRRAVLDAEMEFIDRFVGVKQPLPQEEEKENALEELARLRRQKNKGRVKTRRRSSQQEEEKAVIQGLEFSVGVQQRYAVNVGKYPQRASNTKRNVGSSFRWIGGPSYYCGRERARENDRSAEYHEILEASNNEEIGG